METHKEIDTRGLNCPLPILKAKKALAEMASGQLLKVLATDVGSVRDFQAFAKQTGNELVEQQTVGEEFIHVLRRRDRWVRRTVGHTVPNRALGAGKPIPG